MRAVGTSNLLDKIVGVMKLAPSIAGSAPWSYMDRCGCLTEEPLPACGSNTPFANGLISLWIIIQIDHGKINNSSQDKPLLSENGMKFSNIYFSMPHLREQYNYLIESTKVKLALIHSNCYLFCKMSHTKKRKKITAILFTVMLCEVRTRIPQVMCKTFLSRKCKR